LASGEARLAVTLAAPLESLIVPDMQVRFGPDVDGWDLPEMDRVALRRHGLPKGPLTEPAPQTEAEPTLVPNVAGETEHRLVAPEKRLYALGRWGVTDFTPMVGAVAGSGRGLGIRPAPITPDEYPAALRDYYDPASLAGPAVTFISSSVAQYVEVSWRWHAATRFFMTLEEPPPGLPFDEAWQYHLREQELRMFILAGLAAIDPAIGDDRWGSLWASNILEP